ncbi:MAG: TFIIB-type zinc ribbon-containing protein [Clostridiales bacterium]|nr:TFIIB-type zinc ribbon-containing protein [Clostridiales bacterium]
MSQTVTFKCPACGGYLEFDPEGQRFLCSYCGASFNDNEIHQQSEAKEEAAEQAEQPSGGLRSYHCQMCGAEIVTDDTTAASRCYYCHNPVMMTDRLTEEFKPDGVIPFQLDRKQAEERFSAFVNSKKFIDKAFFTPQQMEDFSGVYYPYWFADVEGEASFEGQGTRVSVATTPKKTVTTTRYFAVRRKGRLSFRSMVRKALSKADRKLSDGIHPYDLDQVKPFAMGYLSGFLAEKRDVEAETVKPEMLQEAQAYAQSMMSSKGSFNSLNGNTDFRATKTSMKYMLLPAWVLTYKGGNNAEPYYYMMNGQTGVVCGKLPLKKSKLLLWSLLLGAAVCAVLCVGGAVIW